MQADKASWLLKLYIARPGVASMRARQTLERLCQEHIEGRYRIKVIDLLLG